MKFIDLSKQDQVDVLDRVSTELNIRQREVIEKDWWVTAVLRAMFSLPYAGHLSFKGGTSLSKCWHLIDRFSEDIDIAIDREFLGFSGTLSKTQISDRLRRVACSFVREQMQYDLAKQLCDFCIDKDKFDVNVDITPVSTTDPEVININYNSAVADILSLSISNEDGQYILPKVKVEVSGRSMSEPVNEIAINSMIDHVYPNAPFAEHKFNVRAVHPERTFLEKVFLLHEEFAKPKDMIRVERMSRHMYDIGQMLKTPIAEKAINDERLYCQVVEHRRTFIGLSGFNYNTLYPATLNIIPPTEVIEQWRTDYENMRLHMIYGESVPFDGLVEELTALMRHLNNKSFKN
ncbi:nucleotidyl transferase AbiEii/AbiGii toxin family protein [Parabacteroides sp. ZJ-118]|uniref:nucleotidyl transferase AbiEii/AbiGii toxin family protein n=1 Tax=Parabacteroides sp. ZJ-118 TaxID=2709398 RepID=UPI0013EADFFE|nr:nucleotidyl transferase AbiEii/AbiGii toxin family protein [Parabacteroides sp. ZJ-118]